MRVPPQYRAVTYLVAIPTLACLLALVAIGLAGATPRTAPPIAHRATQARLSGSGTGHTTLEQARRHSHARWMAERRHAAALRRQAAEIAHIEHLEGAGSWRDWVTTRTGDWSCIRDHEEGMAAAPANMFGFVPFSGGTDTEQRAEALSILHGYGWGAWSTAPGCGL